MMSFKNYFEWQPDKFHQARAKGLLDDPKAGGRKYPKFIEARNASRNDPAKIYINQSATEVYKQLAKEYNTDEDSIALRGIISHKTGNLYLASRHELIHKNILTAVNEHNIERWPTGIYRFDTNIKNFLAIDNDGLGVSGNFTIGESYSYKMYDIYHGNNKLFTQWANENNWDVTERLEPIFDEYRKMIAVYGGKLV